MTIAPDTLLQVDDLKTYLPLEEGLLKAVDGVSLEIKRGQTIGLVGESGSGKSMMAQSLMRIAPGFSKTFGSIYFRRRSGDVVDLNALEPQGETIRSIRGGEIGMIFQEPMTSFSPLYTIGNQIMEAVLLHRTPNKKEARETAIDMLGRVGISNPRERIDNYPHQLSGGMRQRAMIAMALSCEPTLLIADEPTTALDVTVQAQVLRLMQDLQQEFGMSILYITHDLGVIARTVEHVAVMYLGQIVEFSDVDSLFYAPKHPYTQALLRAIPKMGRKTRKRLESIQGSVPVPINKPRACSFYPRCPVAVEGICNKEVPPLVRLNETQKAACFLYPEVVQAAEGVHNV